LRWPNALLPPARRRPGRGTGRAPGFGTDRKTRGHAAVLSRPQTDTPGPDRRPANSGVTQMATKNPFDFSDMFKMFDPMDAQKMFDPQRMFSMFEPPRSPGFDMTGVFEMNRKNFEAMTEANTAAASAYKDLLQKQMEVFQQLTTAAREHVAWIDETSGPGALSKKTEAYGEAVEKALVLMRKLAEGARDANEEAYAQVKGQVDDAMAELKSKSR
jgi:hypothetical protein